MKTIKLYDYQEVMLENIIKMLTSTGIARYRRTLGVLTVTL